MGAIKVTAQKKERLISTLHKHKYGNLPQSLIDAAIATERVPYDPDKHINFKPPQKIFSFKELKQDSKGISPNAVSEPFPLFSEEAVKQMRAELFCQNVLESNYCPTSATSGIIRGHCPRKAAFIYDAWNCPKVLAAVSKVAGIELVPAMDYDIGHVNISINSDGKENGDVAPGEQLEASEFCESSFGWHRDSYPFVVVMMLSDCTGMVGGETAIRTERGDIIKARGPALGTAVLMQGRYIDHQATAALGGQERTSMVTSFRPKSPFVKDETILRGVRNISHIPTLYSQFMTYRLENFDKRIREELHTLYEDQNSERGFDIRKARAWMEEQRDFLDYMLQEIRE